MTRRYGVTARDLRARVALAGHVVALVVLVALLAPGHGGLFRPGDCGEAGPLPPLSTAPGEPARASLFLLVVVDALRADTASDPAVMPHLSTLAASADGTGRGLARTETLVPSTIAGIEALATGACPPAVSFFDDFRAAAADRGGILQAVSEAGGVVRVYGPRLWRDRYGPWIRSGLAGPALETDDDEVLAAALGGLADASSSASPQLVVVHLSGLDAAAHRHGAASPGYRREAARADAALGRLLAATPPRTAVLVTSDHGVTASGGHAGLEPPVVTTPVVTRGPGLPHGRFGVVRQQDVPRLVLRSLGLPAPEPPPLEAAPGGFGVAPSLLLLALIVAAAWVLLGVGATPAAGPPFSTVAVGGFWLALAIVPWGGPRPAWIFAAGCLLVPAAWAVLRGSRARIPGLGWALAVGGLAGSWRWWDGLRASDVVPVSAVALVLLLCAGAVAVPGWIVLNRALTWRPGRSATGVGTGVFVVVAAMVLARWTGETASLSTLDVRPAFWAVEGLGLTVAIAAAVLRQGLPCLVVVSGLWWARSVDRGSLPAGLGAALLGQSLAPAVTWQAFVGPLESSVAFGHLLRLLAENFYLFAGLALVVSWGSQEKRPGSEDTGA